MSSAPNGFPGLSIPCRKVSAHAGHMYADRGSGVRCPGVQGLRGPVDAEQLLADVRLVAQLADQDVRRFATDVLEACAAADAAQGAPGDLTTDEIRALLQRTADGR